MRFLTLALLALASQAFAIDVPEGERVVNSGPNCLYSNLATLGHVHGIAPLQALSRDGKVIPQNRDAVDSEVVSRLQALRVRHKLTRHGSYDRSLLSQANARGVIVSCKPGALWCYGNRLTRLHSILLTKWDESGVEFLCPNNPRAKPWRASAQWFRDWWAGNSLVIE